MKKRATKPVFKHADQNQQMLLPPSLDELIDEKHPVRIVNKIIDQIDLTVLYAQYEGGGASSYDPRMLLKVLIYAYLSNTYSSRKISSQLRENIYFMWLSGMSKPDHNSINRFRSHRLKHVLKSLFSEIIKLLNSEGVLCIKDIYTDGTKIEANANRYTFVWGKTIQTRKQKIAKQIDELWRYAETVTKEELTDTSPTSFKEISSEKVSRTVNKIDEILQGHKIDPKIKAKLKRVKKDWPEQLDRYEVQESILSGRNSYSKTDPDATFMRMKDDHFKNGQLKPAYNVQISTHEQYIVNYSIHQNPGDTTTLIKHLMNYYTSYDNMPEELTADAGYGSEENYEFTKRNNIEAYVKYNNFHKEDSHRWKKDIRRSENLYYNEQTDTLYCPMGQAMHKTAEYDKPSRLGYVQRISKYEAQNCNGCPLRGACHKGSRNRIVEINHNARKHRKEIKEKLQSTKGLEKRRRRPIEPETVFGNIKHNKHFNRFMLRGIENVEIELGLIALGHNLAKYAKISAKNILGFNKITIIFITIHDITKYNSFNNLIIINL